MGPSRVPVVPVLPVGSAPRVDPWRLQKRTIALTYEESWVMMNYVLVYWGMHILYKCVLIYNIYTFCVGKRKHVWNNYIISPLDILSILASYFRDWLKQTPCLFWCVQPFFLRFKCYPLISVEVVLMLWNRDSLRMLRRRTLWRRCLRPHYVFNDWRVCSNLMRSDVAAHF